MLREAVAAAAAAAAALAVEMAVAVVGSDNLRVTLMADCNMMGQGTAGDSRGNGMHSGT